MIKMLSTAVFVGAALATAPAHASGVVDYATTQAAVNAALVRSGADHWFYMVYDYERIPTIIGPFSDQKQCASIREFHQAPFKQPFIVPKIARYSACWRG